ncbi:DUF3243 domain-containing protein [Halothermothrix orenii]|uniref:DUF3243 domain-containing protein n=1 Tax=Halothermothrix orenii (strain H 168 / OCM 544 / DSM 9562) TaxID=373903 RepID=B8D0V8_HALOH|nr:DUF3243 domain-containing protein [Halothermothrix orenii]ACL68927.1 hypothetical protein Hore_01650 [Halothermothrix orenii H 168]
MERYSDWDKWKKNLGQAVNLGKKIGLSEETVVKVGEKIGDFLEKRVEPENREQRVLKELWDVASQDEQRHLASMIVKMVQKDGKEGDRA